MVSLIFVDRLAEGPMIKTFLASRRPLFKEHANNAQKIAQRLRGGLFRPPRNLLCIVRAFVYKGPARGQECLKPMVREFFIFARTAPVDGKKFRSHRHRPLQGDSKVPQGSLQGDSRKS